jgi:S1-C subfamily serine protease
MALDTRNSVVLITSGDPDNSAFGTGFVIHRDAQASYLLTCAHVVRDVGGPDSTHIAGQPTTVIASGEDSFPDIAVLRVEGMLDRPPLSLQSEAQTGDAFLTDGFQTFRQNYLHRPIRGVLGTQVELAVKNRAERVWAWDLSIIGDYDLQSGYSGSPVILETTGAVVAVASHTLGQKKGLAISVSDLMQLWPAAPETLFHSSAAPNIAVKPPTFSAIKHKVRQNRLTLLMQQYEAVMAQMLRIRDDADRVILEQQEKHLGQQIEELEDELQELVR